MSTAFQGIILFGQSLRERRAVHISLLALYYAFIVAGLLLLYGRGDFSTPPFVYQGF